MKKLFLLLPLLGVFLSKAADVQEKMLAEKIEGMQKGFQDLNLKAVQCNFQAYEKLMLKKAQLFGWQDQKEEDPVKEQKILSETQKNQEKVAWHNRFLQDKVTFNFMDNPFMTQEEYFQGHSIDSKEDREKLLQGVRNIHLQNLLMDVALCSAGVAVAVCKWHDHPGVQELSSILGCGFAAYAGLFAAHEVVQASTAQIALSFLDSTIKRETDERLKSFNEEKQKHDSTVEEMKKALNVETLNAVLSQDEVQEMDKFVKEEAKKQQTQRFAQIVIASYLMNKNKPIRPENL